MFAGLRGGVGDIFRVDLETENIDNLTVDEFNDFGPTFSPDGNYILYIARISGNQKLWRVDLDTKTKTQITFGTHDDSAAQFLDSNTIVFSSTATNPALPIEPDVARNGTIYNIWTLDLQSGELQAIHGCARRKCLAHRRERRAAADCVRQLLPG